MRTIDKGKSSRDHTKMQDGGVDVDLSQHSNGDVHKLKVSGCPAEQLPEVLRQVAAEYERSLAGGNPPTPTAPTAPTGPTTPIHPGGLTAKQSADWFESNFHKGTVPSPTGPMTELQVISWMQVPHILQRLQNGNEQIRVSFPDVTPKDTAVTAEQEAIRRFLVDHAGKEMKEITAHVTAEIEKCQIFAQKLVTFTAADYVAQFKLDDKNSDQLTVAEVIRTDKHFEPTKAGAPRKGPAIAGRDIILSAIEKGIQVTPTTEFRSYVIEVVEAHDPVAKRTLVDRYNSWSPKPDVQHVKVWVCPDFTTAAAKVDEFDLLTYIGGAAGGSPKPVVAGRKKRAATP